MFLFNLIQHITPFVIAMWDAGWHQSFDADAAKEYLEVWLEEKGLV